MTPGTESFEDQHRAWAAFARSRQLPLNRWVWCRSRTLSSGEIVDRIRADGDRPVELMRVVNSAIYGFAWRISSIQMP